VYHALVCVNYADLKPFNSGEEESMLSSYLPSLAFLRLILLITVLPFLLANPPVARPASSAYVRVNQAGYETGSSMRAYLMSTALETGATFKIVNSGGNIATSGKVGALLGVWSHSKSLAYHVYAIDFSVPGGDVYEIKVSGPVAAAPPKFAVDCPELLYSGLLLNTLFFYETERDGKNFDPNALRTAPGHLKDANARVCNTPPLDVNDFVDNVPPVAALTITCSGVIRRLVTCSRPSTFVAALCLSPDPQELRSAPMSRDVWLLTLLSAISSTA
jgi:hypothetical protein